MDNNSFILFLLIAGPVVLFFLMQLASGKSKINKADLTRRWNRVLQLRAGSEPQFAVIEADKVFDSVLKQLGFKGDTMADRLKNAQPSLVDADGLWVAHKLRNRLVHDNDIKVAKADIQSAIASYEKSLKGFGAL